MKFWYIGFLILILFLTPFCLLSKDKIISFSKDQTEIEVPGYKLKDIINATGEQFYIGYRLNNANFAKEPLRFKRDIGSEFEDYLSPLYASEGKEIVIRLNKIFHYEVMLEETMIVITDMNISFLEVSTNSFGEIYRAAVSIHEGRSKIKNVQLAIDLCLSNFNIRVTENKLMATSCPIDSINLSPLKDYDHKNFKLENRKQKGIFWTYDDFFFNTPDTLTKIAVDYKDRINRQDSLIIKHATLVSKNDRKDINNAWGFADGSKIFVRVGNRYFPMLVKKDGFYLEFKVNSNSGVMPAAIIGGVLGGIIGGVALGIAAGFIPSTGNSGNQLLKLDLSSGSFDVFIKPGHKKVTSTIIFYSSDKNDELFELFIDDTLRCNLTPGQWHKIELPSSMKVVEVSIADQDGKKFTSQIEPRLFHEDIYICYERNKKPPFFRKVNPQTAISIMDQLTKENKIK